MKRLRLLAAHRRYYVREMRLVAYKQLLESYRRSAPPAVVVVVVGAGAGALAHPVGGAAA